MVVIIIIVVNFYNYSCNQSYGAESVSGSEKHGCYGTWVMRSDIKG